MNEFPPFERNTRAPHPLPPPGSCDSQIHVFGDAARYPTAASAIYGPPPGSLAEAQLVHRAMGIERGIIAQASIYGTDHRLLLDALKGQRNYKGVAIIDDTVSDAALQELHRAGIRGARFNFAKFLGIVPDPQVFKRSIERIAPLGWFIKLHAHGEELVEHQELFQPLTLPVMIDHLGHPDFALGMEQPAIALIMDLLKRPNWWMMLANGDRFSISGAPWADTTDLARAYIAAAPDRIVWGTDWPHVRYRRAMPNDADLLELLYRYVPDAATRRAILVDNPARIFGFAG